MVSIEGLQTSVLRITEPCEILFSEDCIFDTQTQDAIIVEAPNVRLINPKTRNSPRGIQVLAPYCTIENPQGENHNYMGLSWWGKTHHLTVLGGIYKRCAVGLYGVSNDHGANHVTVEGTIIEDGLVTDFDKHLFGLQNGSYGYYDVTLRNGIDGFAAYQKQGCKMRYNTFHVKAENCATAFKFGGDANAEGELHNGNRLYLDAMNCQTGLRLKTKKTWKVYGTLTNCKLPFELTGADTDFNIKIRSL